MLKVVRRAVRRGHNTSGDGYVRDWPTGGKFEVGGVRMFWRGFAKRGVRANPPNPPPGYGPARPTSLYLRHGTNSRKIFSREDIFAR